MQYEAVALRDREGVKFVLAGTDKPAYLQLYLLVSEGEVYKTHANAIAFNLQGRSNQGAFCVVRTMWNWRQWWVSNKGVLSGSIPWFRFSG